LRLHSFALPHFASAQQGRLARVGRYECGQPPGALRSRRGTGRTADVISKSALNPERNSSAPRERVGQIKRESAHVGVLYPTTDKRDYVR
jgi:hypothetical protein